MTGRIGILGGTFDPIHMGHLVCADQARCQYNLDKVLFMVAGQPALKDAADVSPAEHRYQMALLATADNPFFELSRLEIDRAGTSYTIDTLKELRRRSASTTKLFFICGADALFEILSWKDAEKIAELATFVCATRPGYDLDEARALLERQAVDFRFEQMEVPLLDISSSDLRERFQSGRSVRYLVPEEVERYVRERGLYL